MRRLEKRAVTSGCLAGVQHIDVGYSSGGNFTGQVWNSGLHQGSSPSFKQSDYSCLSLVSTSPAVFGEVSTLFNLWRQGFHELLVPLPSSFGGKRSRSNGLVVLHLLLVLWRRGTSSQEEQPFSISTWVGSSIDRPPPPSIRRAPLFSSLRPIRRWKSAIDLKDSDRRDISVGKRPAGTSGHVSTSILRKIPQKEEKGAQSPALSQNPIRKDRSSRWLRVVKLASLFTRAWHAWERETKRFVSLQSASHTANQLATLYPPGLSLSKLSCTEVKCVCGSGAKHRIISSFCFFLFCLFCCQFIISFLFFAQVLFHFCQGVIYVRVRRGKRPPSLYIRGITLLFFCHFLSARRNTSQELRARSYDVRLRHGAA